jgi:chromosome segregation ATPase
MLLKKASRMSASPVKQITQLQTIDENKENRRSTRRSSASTVNSSFDGGDSLTLGKERAHSYSHDESEDVSALRDQLAARDREITFLHEKLSTESEKSETPVLSKEEEIDLRAQLIDMKKQFDIAENSIATLTFQLDEANVTLHMDREFLLMGEKAEQAADLEALKSKAQVSSGDIVAAEEREKALKTEIAHLTETVQTLEQDLVTLQDLIGEGDAGESQELIQANETIVNLQSAIASLEQDESILQQLVAVSTGGAAAGSEQLSQANETMASQKLVIDELEQEVIKMVGV